MENGKKSAAENFGQMFKEFGSAIAEIFNDPDLKAKSKEFAESAAQSAKAFAARFKDEDVKERFKEVGKAAQNLGKNVSDYFKTDKEEDISKEDSQPKQESPISEEKDDLKEEAEDNKEDTDKESVLDTIAPSASKKPFDKNFDKYFSSSRPARITGYVFGAIFALAWMIFVLFFNNYIACYYVESQGAVSQLQIVPILTSEFNTWLPVFAVSILIAIVGNLILIFFERFFLVKIVSVLISGALIAKTAYLLWLFPFDFSLLPNIALKSSANIITTVILIFIIIGCAATFIVDLVKLIIFFKRSCSTKNPVFI